ncbi:CRIB domain-containing protein [Trichostrongylus colubriformis]|uniref:CRIB domain-containing protein n=1 Tax=Trichostrongylus colubriformis TaxID=6319 RepID=A0AAN8FMV1_TRICO
MTVGSRNDIVDHYEDGKQQKFSRENRISSHLTDAEQRSILASLKPSAKALCTGVCQLLQAENKMWTDIKVGVICFIRDPNIKEYVLSLLLPKADDRLPAKVLWTMTVSAFFETERTSDEHLLTFIMETFPRDVCGLNFYDPREADEFHRILVEENRGRISRRAKANRPKRHAPPPPSEVCALEAIDRLSLLSNGAPVDDNEKKESRKSFLGGLFTMRKKKKERKKLEISAPTHFQHIDHLGLEELSKEDQETFHHLIKVVDIEPGNEDQIRLLRNIVATRGSEVRSSMRIKRNSIRPSDTFVRGNTHTTLAESRNSMMVAHKQQRRTPREVKKGSSKRQEAETAPIHTQQQQTSISEVTIDQYLNPNWDTAAPSYEVHSKLHVITESQEPTKVPYNGRPPWSVEEPEAPPVPSRIESMAASSLPAGRRESPSYSPGYRTSPPLEPAPQLHERHKPEREVTNPIWRIEVPLPSGVQPPSHSPPPTPPSSQPSPVPNSTATSVSPTSTGATGGSAPISLAPPPPPPPGLLSPAPTPPPCSDAKQRSTDVSPIFNDRRSFLEEIQNVDKGRLRHVDPTSKPLQNADSPTGDGGLLLAIQAELDKRREYIASDSDEDSDSDSEWID